MHSAPVTAGRRGVFVAEVLANRPMGGDHFRMQLAADGFPLARPGQFIQLQCRPLDPQGDRIVADWPADRPPRLSQSELRDVEPFLRRPLSLAGCGPGADGRTELVLIYRVVGTGTRWLTGLAPGEQLSVLGPLGNGFATRDSAPAAALVGGGVGIPPLIFQAAALASAGKRTIAFCGARRAELLPLTPVPAAKVSRTAKPTPCLAEFASHGVPAVVATDDGSLGCHGLISEAFTVWLEKSSFVPGQITVYACGPEAMMRAVAELCIAMKIECQLAMERHMACGMGTCQSCVVKVHSDEPLGWAFKLCCADGPVFDAREIVW
jgi:dihydroorotate dehydrogenase electron transfer subunit